MAMKQTRTKILARNYESIRLHGFQGLRTDQVLDGLGITKGAFYHHFKDKLSLGYAIVDEIVSPQYLGIWDQITVGRGNVLDKICHVINLIASQSNVENIHLGCALNNLIQEMCPLDNGFQARLGKIIQTQVDMISLALAQGIEKNEVLKGTTPQALANFIIASLEGCYTIGKALNSLDAFNSAINQLKSYLQAFKPTKL